jgi:hypothetical protein
MKCIDCGKESTKKDRQISGGRCTGCYHAFVTEPLEDGLTDMAIKSAVDAVSSNGTLYFSKDQLRYQLQRKLNKKIKACSIGLGISLVAFIVLLVFAIITRGVFVILCLFSVVTLIATLVFKSKLNTNISKLPELVDKWLTINPHEKLLTAEKAQADITSVSNANLDDISFDKVLICERDETVDFFLSNLFHFHYSCPVLGGSGYPKGVFEDMLRRLKQNPNVKVFILHDHSPAGIAFARKVKTDAKWFGGKRYDIVDLGLNAEQKKKLFKDMTYRFTDRNKKIKETAEVALFAPAALIGLCGAAINEGVPFDLVTSAAAAAAASGSNGYG